MENWLTPIAKRCYHDSRGLTGKRVEERNIAIIETYMEQAITESKRQMYKVMLLDRNGPFNHEVYFDSIPTQLDVLESIYRDQKIAGPEYDSFYDQCIVAAKNFNWPQRWGNYAEIGEPINEGTYVRIKKVQVISNG